MTVLVPAEVLDFEVGLLVAGELVVGEILVGRLILDELVADEFVVGETVADRFVARELVVDEFVAGELIAEELVTGEPVAVGKRDEENDDIRLDDTEVTVDEDADAERVLALTFRGETPSQTKAKELKATSAKHSPSKTPSN